MKRILLTAIFVFSINALLYSQADDSIYKTGERTIHFKDENRNRRLITEVWYPANNSLVLSNSNYSPFIVPQTITDAEIADGKFPLILFSHGTGGNRMALEWFTAGLAEHGYIVAAVDHYGNTFDNPIPVEFVKIWERPLDLSYILNQLLSSGYFKNFIDTSRIGAAGFSLGGFSVIALAGGKLNFDALRNYFKTPAGKKEASIPEMPGIISYFDSASVIESFKNSPDLYDHRIKCIFAMAPAAGQGFTTAKQFELLKAPVFIIDTEKDSIAPIETNALHYALLIKTAKVKILKGEGSHYIFLNTAKEQLKQQSPIYFKDPPSVDRTKFHDEVLREAIQFFNKILK